MPLIQENYAFLFILTLLITTTNSITITRGFRIICGFARVTCSFLIFYSGMQARELYEILIPIWIKIEFHVSHGGNYSYNTIFLGTIVIMPSHMLTSSPPTWITYEIHSCNMTQHFFTKLILTPMLSLVKLKESENSRTWTSIMWQEAEQYIFITSKFTTVCVTLCESYLLI